MLPKRAGVGGPLQPNVHGMQRVAAGGFPGPGVLLSEADFQSLYNRLRDGTDWGPADRRGALNNITAAQILSAAGLVQAGITVSLAAPAERLAADNPEPATRHMLGLEAEQAASGLHFARDRLEMNIHGTADSHMDALCHAIYNGALYNGVSADTVTPEGATALAIDVARDGVTGRGVLLDIPRQRGVSWLEPGDHVTVGDLRAAEEAEEVTVGQGDLLFVRVGHRRRRDELGPWDVAGASAGLHPTALEFVAERHVAALGSDGNNDTMPSMAVGVAFPVHVLALNAMGLHLLDYLQFEDLVPLCERLHRWTFLCVIAPLRLPMATGSPINPIAIL